MTLSHAVTGYWWACIASAVGIVWAFRKWKRTDKGRGQWDAFRLRIPMKIGDIVQKIALARWSRTLSALVSRRRADAAGARHHRARPRATASSRTRWRSVIDSVKQGGTIAEPLRRPRRCSPAWSSQMVAVGEETGALDAMLSKIADFYEDEVDAAVKSLTSILEPLMIVVVGGMVGFIVISMYLPLFKVYDQIR